MKTKICILACILLIQVAAKAQMKIGDNPTSVNAASLLELETTNKGLAFPRVSLSSTSASTPLPTGLLTGTVVYNTNASVTGGNGVGLYVWNGTVWQSLASGSSINSLAWSLSGNAGISPASNFLGTTDNISIRFRTNNVQRMIIDSLGRVGIGLNNPTYALSVLGTNPLYLSGVQATSTLSTDSILTISGGVVKKTASSNLSSAWSLNGNAGTTSNNFLGTTDNMPLIIKTNSTQSAYFDVKNNVIFSPNTPTSIPGNYNLGIGSQVMSGTNSGSNNFAVGTNALSTNSGNYNVAVGSSALSSNLGSYNFGLGDQSLSSNANGANYNVAVGNSSLSSNSGLYNIAVGSSAMSSNKGSYNLAIGDQVLAANNNGSNYNIAFGSKAMNGTNGGSYNFALGTNSLNTNSGSYNVSIGANAMLSSKGSYNFALGSGAMDSSTNGANYNFAMGSQAMNGTNTGLYNFAFGNSALNSNTGSNNFAFGNSTLSANKGSNNFAFGNNALTANTTGANNIAIGANAMDLNTTGSNNIAIGQGADVLSANLSNAIAIGNNASVGASNSMVLGDSASTANALNVGIGVRAPQKRLHIDASPISNSSANDSLKIDNLASSFSAANKSILVRDSITGFVSNQSLNTLGSGNFWSLTGNAATTFPNNFLGTTDNIGLRFRTNNAQRMIIDSLGRVGIGTSSMTSSFNADNPAKLAIDYGNTTSNTIVAMKGSIPNYLQMNLQNLSNDINASTDYVATADNGTDSTNYIDMGINSSNYTTGPDYWGGPNDGYLYTYSRNLLIGTQKASSDIIFLVAGGSIRTNTALRILGPSGLIVVGKGENTSVPSGNTIRAANAGGSSSNIAGGILTLSGGSSTTGGLGGALNLSGGAGLGAGTGGAVNITSGTSASGTAGAVNINTGTSAGIINIGGNANNIVMPKFNTVGGMYYTSLSSGQLSTTGANMTWDSVNSRLGIGLTNPGYKLSVLAASNPLYLSGLQTTTSLSSDSVLTINGGVVKKVASSSFGGGSGWSLTGNSGTNAGTNFLGTTDAQALIFKSFNNQIANLDGNTAVGNIAIGLSAVNSSSDHNVAIGYGASTNNQYVTAIGSAASANGVNAVAIGGGPSGSPTKANGAQSVAIGYNVNVTTDQTVAIGYQAQGTGQYGVAIGYNPTSSAQQGVAIGYQPTVSGQYGVAIGYQPQATAVQSIAIGYQAKAQAQYNTVMGYQALATSGNQATAIGSTAQAQAQNTVAVGYNALATVSDRATAIGAFSQAQAQNNIAVGYNTKATNSDKITVIGSDAQGSFQNNTVVGYGATATSNNQSTAIGASSQANSQNATSLGYNARATANNSTAIGMNTSVSGSNSTVIGYNASTSQSNALILGDATNTSLSVGIGTSTPNTNAKLDVDGNFKLGDLGKVVKNLVTLTGTPSASGTVNANSYLDIVFTAGSNFVTSTQATVAVSPSFDMNANLYIGYARLIANNQIRVRLVNVGSSAQSVPVSNFYFSITEY